MDIEDKVGANQSGVAKVMDRSAQNNTIFTVASRMCDVIFNNQFYFINKYMNGTEDSSAGKNTDENLPQVNRPTSFDIETSPELLAGLKDAKDAGVDRNLQQAKELAYLTRDMETNPNAKKYYSTIVELDPLFGMTPDEISLNLSIGIVRKTDATIHANLKPFVDKAIEEKRDFMDLPKDQKLAILEKYANELIASEKPKLDANVMADGSAGAGAGN